MAVAAGAGAVGTVGLASAISQPIIDESKSAIATTISGLFATLRLIATYVFTFVHTIFRWMARHPLASFLIIADIIILIS
jgi:hypothetical protein